MNKFRVLIVFITMFNVSNLFARSYEVPPSTSSGGTSVISDAAIE